MRWRRHSLDFIGQTVNPVQQCLCVITQGCRHGHISKSKTKTMHEGKQQVCISTIQEIKHVESDYKHECQFCGRKCKTQRGLHIHMAACNRQHGLTDEVFTIDGINTVFGTPECRWYRYMVRWYEDNDTWETAVINTTRLWGFVGLQYQTDLLKFKI